MTLLVSIVLGTNLVSSKPYYVSSKPSQDDGLLDTYMKPSQDDGLLDTYMKPSS
jgi:hypothetical protein